MTSDEIQSLAKVLKTFVDEEKELTKEIHMKHHAYIEHLMQESENNFKSYFKIRDAILGWLVMISLLGLGRMAWDYIMHSVVVK
jgi:hypothetical protein